MVSLSKVAELLHTKLAEELLDRVSKGTATTADLNVARQFLKDNGIDSVAKAGPMRDLASVLPFQDGDPIRKTN